MKKVYLLLFIVAVVPVASSGQQIMSPDLFKALITDLCECQSQLINPKLIMEQSCISQLHNTHGASMDSAMVSYIQQSPFRYSEAQQRYISKFSQLILDSLVYHCPYYNKVVETYKYQNFKKNNPPESLKRQIKRNDKVIKKDSSPENIYERALLLYSIDKKEAALAVLNILLEDHREFSNAYFLRAVLREQEGNFSGALLDYQTVQSYLNLSGNTTMPIWLYITALKKKMADQSASK